jgi:hypothetical protein
MVTKGENESMKRPKALVGNHGVLRFQRYIASCKTRFVLNWDIYI